MNDISDDQYSDPDSEVPELYEPVPTGDEFRRAHFSRIDCRCCGCSGTTLLIVLLVIIAFVIYHFIKS